MNFFEFFNFQLIKEAKDLEGYYKVWNKKGILVSQDRDLEDAFKIVDRAGKYNNFFKSYKQPTFYETHPQEYKEDLIDFAKKIKELSLNELELKSLDKKIKEEAVENVIYENDKFWILAPENHPSSVKCARYKKHSKDWLEYKNYYQSEDERNFPSHELVDPAWCVAYPNMNSYWQMYGCNGENYSVFYVCSKKSYNHRWAIVMKSIEDLEYEKEEIESLNADNFLDYIEEIRNPKQLNQDHENYEEIWNELLNYFKINPTIIVDIIKKYYSIEKKIGETNKNIYFTILEKILDNYEINKSLIKFLDFNQLMAFKNDNNEQDGPDEKLYNIFNKAVENGKKDNIIKFCKTKLKNNIYPISIVLYYISLKNNSVFEELLNELKDIPFITNNIEIPIQEDIFDMLSRIENDGFTKIININKNCDFTSLDNFDDKKIKGLGYTAFYSKKILQNYKIKDYKTFLYLLADFCNTFRESFKYYYDDENLIFNFFRRNKDCMDINSVGKILLYIIFSEGYNPFRTFEFLERRNINKLHKSIYVFNNIYGKTKKESLKEIINFCSDLKGYDCDKNAIINLLRAYDLLKYFNIRLKNENDYFFDPNIIDNLTKISNIDDVNRLYESIIQYIDNRLSVDIKYLKAQIDRKNIVKNNGFIGFNKEDFKVRILEPIITNLNKLHNYEEEIIRYNLDLTKLEANIKSLIQIYYSM